MAGPGTVDDVLRVIAGQAEQPKYIRAYHGSPYGFDRFDASKIGTGEGAQAYGHGMYFAGDENVARSYRDSLKDMVSLPVPDELDAQLMQVISEIGQLSRQRGKVVGGEWDAVQKQLDQKQDLMMALQHQYRAAAQNPGRMYEVELGVPGGALLDWDAPLRSQPVVTQRIPDYANAMDSDATGYHLYDWMKLWHGGPKNASEALLKEHGIPGIRYLDGNSRAAGQGTSNYVMFPGTEDSIRILRKFGLMAPIAAGAAMEQR